MDDYSAVIMLHHTTGRGSGRSMMGAHLSYGLWSSFGSTAISRAGWSYGSTPGDIAVDGLSPVSSSDGATNSYALGVPEWIRSATS
jgi:hypothetical protein